MRISTDRRERLRALAPMRRTVKMLPITSPSGRSMQLSPRV
jgi:hypothetical protein